MQRIINIPDMVVEDMLKGFVKAHSDLVEPTENPRVLKSKWAGEKGRVGVVTGGGSGHKPAFIGYCGKNMCDAIAVGEIFSSPTAKAFYDAFREADGGEGVACLYGNYAGDNMNVKMAIELAEDDDIVVKKVVANDDVASAPKTEPEERRQPREARWTRLSPLPRKPSTIPALWVSASRPAPFLLWDIRISRSNPARWKLVSAITANPASKYPN